MILVTGATGHLGNVLVRELISSGEKVRALIPPGGPLLSIEGMPVEIIFGDILNRDQLKKAMHEVKTVFNLAGIIAIRPGMEDLMWKVNVEGARNVAEVALESRIERLVHVSSVHAFRRERHGITIDEKTPLALESQIGSYDRTKAEGTKAVLEVVEKGLDAVIACPSGIIGSHDYLESEMGQTLVSFASRKLDILVDGAYDFVDVRDVARGLIQARDKGISGEIYILSGTRVTISDLHRMAQKTAGIISPRIVVPMKLAMLATILIQKISFLLKTNSRYTVYALQTLVDNSVFSYQKAWHDLEYKPRPLAEAVSDFLKWWNLQQKKSRVKPKGKFIKKRRFNAIKETTGS